jgi:hypothetical protein
MTGIDSYMNSYMDRRMKDIVDEWRLATRRDAADLEHRIRDVEQDLQSLDDFEKMADSKMTVMESRLARLKEAKK